MMSHFLFKNILQSCQHISKNSKSLPVVHISGISFFPQNEKKQQQQYWFGWFEFEWNILRVEFQMQFYLIEPKENLNFSTKKKTEAFR